MMAHQPRQHRRVDRPEVLDALSKASGLSSKTFYEAWKILEQESKELEQASNKLDEVLNLLEPSSNNSEETTRASTKRK